jgi:hypothetical protein
MASSTAAAWARGRGSAEISKLRRGKKAQEQHACSGSGSGVSREQLTPLEGGAEGGAGLGEQAGELAHAPPTMRGAEWQVHTSRSTGQRYWFNEITGESTYERPATWPPSEGLPPPRTDGRIDYRSGQDQDGINSGGGPAAVATVTAAVGISSPLPSSRRHPTVMTLSSSSSAGAAEQPTSAEASSSAEDSAPAGSSVAVAQQQRWRRRQQRPLLQVPAVAAAVGAESLVIGPAAAHELLCALPAALQASTDRHAWRL